MAEPHIAIDPLRRERWIVLAIVTLVVAARSAVFVLRPESYFDADQAIVGLMAKHLSELRAFPVFFYGQTYMLGVEAWLAAPLFAIAGVSATALKIPLLMMNGAIAALLLRAFERDVGLRPALAAVAALPFVLPAPGLASAFLDSNGGTIEPLLYVLLLWVTRRRPLLCGVVFGVGFLNREFTVYGLAALVGIAALDRDLFSRAGGARFGRVAGVAATIWLSVQGLMHLSSASGPDTSVADTFTASNNVAELAGRVCISPASAVSGVERLFSIHWAAILGTQPMPLARFAIESDVWQGLPSSSWLPVAFVVLSIAGIAVAARSRPHAASRVRFAQYLVLAGVFSAAGYVLGRCGEVNLLSMRYELLSVLGIVGLGGWFLAAGAPGALRIAWTVVLAAWMAVVTVPHVRFAAEYGTNPPLPPKVDLIRALDAEGIRYATADYWLAYYVDFMTNERIVIASTSPQRILMYNAIVAEHSGEAVRLLRKPCDGGKHLTAGVYKCP
jgi:hypothetical protein